MYVKLLRLRFDSPLSLIHGVSVFAEYSKATFFGFLSDIQFSFKQKHQQHILQSFIRMLI